MGKYLCVLLGGLVALLSVTACDALGVYKNQLESIVGVTVAGTYTVEIRKNGVLLVTQIWECTSDGTKLTGCHQSGSRTLSTDVVPPGK